MKASLGMSGTGSSKLPNLVTSCPCSSANTGAQAIGTLLPLAIEKVLELVSELVLELVFEIGLNVLIVGR